MIIAHELIRWRESIGKDKPSDFNKLAVLANKDLSEKDVGLWTYFLNALMNKHKIGSYEYRKLHHLYERNVNSRHSKECMLMPPCEVVYTS